MTFTLLEAVLIGIITFYSSYRITKFYVEKSDEKFLNEVNDLSNP